MGRAGRVRGSLAQAWQPRARAARDGRARHGPARRASRGIWLAAERPHLSGEWEERRVRVLLQAARPEHRHRFGRAVGHDPCVEERVQHILRQQQRAARAARAERRRRARPGHGEPRADVRLGARHDEQRVLHRADCHRAELGGGRRRSTRHRALQLGLLDELPVLQVERVLEHRLARRLVVEVEAAGRVAPLHPAGRQRRVAQVLCDPPEGRGGGEEAEAEAVAAAVRQRAEGRSGLAAQGDEAHLAQGRRSTGTKRRPRARGSTAARGKGGTQQWRHAAAAART